MKGATNVTVSLNRGQALVQLAALNTVTIEDVQNVVRKNGFTPKEAQVVVLGELIRRDAEVGLVAGRNRRYPLAESVCAKEKWAQLQKLGSAQRVHLIGAAPSDAGKRIRIEVLDFSVLPMEKKL